MMSEDIFVHRDGQRIKLEGVELEAFLEQRAKDEIEFSAFRAEVNAKAAARESGLAKLLALGLTEDEVKGLVG